MKLFLVKVLLKGTLVPCVNYMNVKKIFANCNFCIRKYSEMDDEEGIELRELSPNLWEVAVNFGELTTKSVDTIRKTVR